MAGQFDNTNPLFRPFLGKPDAAPALGTTIGMPSTTPALVAPISPVVTRTPSQTDNDIAERNRLVSTGSGIDQIKNPLLKGLARAGDIAASVFAPNVAAFIPGTTLHHNMLVNQASRNVAQDQAQEKNAADVADTQAQTQQRQVANANAPIEAKDKHDLTIAQIGNIGSEIQQREHPLPQNEFQLWRQQHPNGTAEEFQQLQSKPLSKEEAASRNAVWDTIAEKYHLPKGQFREGMSSADAAALAASLNNVIGRQQGAQNIVIRNEQAANAANKSQDAQTQKEYTAAAKDLNSQFSTAQTQADTLATARQEINSGAIGQAAGTIKTLVGLAGGKGTGVRITQAELNAIAHARGIQGDFEGAINRLQGKGSLSPEQVRQMDALLGDVENKIREKMGLQDQYLDRLSSAGSPQEIRQIQSEYRKELLGAGKSAVTPPAGANVRDYTSLGGK